MNFADIGRRMRAQESVDLHDLGPDMPELARNALLAAAQRLLVGLVRIVKFLPEPASRTCEDARAVRPQFFTREQIAGALAVVGHADGNIDPGAVEPVTQSVRDVGMKGDRP